MLIPIVVFFNREKKVGNFIFDIFDNFWIISSFNKLSEVVLTKRQSNVTHVQKEALKNNVMP